jgi:hypothetical protein
MFFRDFRPALVFLAAALCAARINASPEDLLPDDTLAFVTAPDAAAVGHLLTNAPQSALWRDPAMQAFRGHFQDSVQTNFLQPLESSLGFATSDFAALVQGQTTLALLQDGWTGNGDTRPAWVLLADVGTATNKLAKKLKFLAKEWTDRERPFRTNLLEGVPFLTWNAASLFPGNRPGLEATNGTSLNLGQSGSLLLLSTSPTAIGRILRRQSGADPKSISAHPALRRSRSGFFTDAVVCGWADPVRMLPPLLRMQAGRESVFRPETIVRFFGLGSLKSAAFAMHCDAGGTRFEISVDSPVAERTGLLKFTRLAAEESAPPMSVPQSVLAVSRFRIDLKAVLAGLEQFVVDAEPAAKGAIELITETAGKDEDPDYSLRHGLLDNLGDDVVVYQPAPSTNTVEALLFPAQVVLLASPAPGRLANAVRVLANTLSPEPGSITIRTLGESRLHRLKSPGGGDDDGGFSFAAVPGYVAFSSDESLIEPLLQPSGTNASSLKDLPGLREAAEQVGGLGTGWFSYQNQRETLRHQLAGVRRLDGGPVDLSLLGRVWLLFNAGQTDRPPLFDYKLFPAFDAVSKYLGYSVAAGQATDDGYRFRLFIPAPPMPEPPAVKPPEPVADPAPAKPGPGSQP